MRSPAALIIFAVVLALGLSGCFRTRAIAAAVVTAKSAAEAEQSESLRHQLADAQKRRDTAIADIATLGQEIAQEKQDKIAKQLLWISLLSLIGFGASVGMMIWLPIAKRTAAGGAVMFAAVGALALTARSLLPYMLWIGLGLLLLGIIVILIRVIPHLKALGEVAASSDINDEVSAKSKKIIAQLRAKFSNAATKRLTKQGA